MLIDSNIIIYASKPEGSKLRSFLDTFPRFVSVISYIESFGYRDLTGEENLQLVRIFRRTRILSPNSLPEFSPRILSLTDAIAQQAVTLRQQRRMGLGDAIIAATALVYNLTLVTHNTEDFRQIAGLELLDPLTNNP